MVLGHSPYPKEHIIQYKLADTAAKNYIKNKHKSIAAHKDLLNDSPKVEKYSGNVWKYQAAKFDYDVKIKNKAKYIRDMANGIVAKPDKSLGQ